MRRPLCIVSIIYIIGILLGLYLQISIALLSIVILSVISLGYIYITKKYRNIVSILFLTIILIIGCMYIKYIDNDYEKMYKDISNLEELQIVAKVITSPIQKQYSSQYEIQILSLNNKQKYKGKKLILNIKDNNNKLQYGDVIKISGEFKVPDEARNYGGFNYKQYLKTKKIYGTLSGNKIIVLDKNVSVGKLINNIREDIKNKLKEVLYENNYDLCIGILIGDREQLDDNIENDFRNSNLTHMLAVSGAHISYVILALSFVIRKIDKRLSKIITIFFLLFFMALINFTPSVTRASIMSILILISSLFHRKSDVYNNLAFSSMLILVINPYTILDIGFQLSFTGTIGIIFFYNKIQACIKQKINYKNKILEYVLNSIIVTISANILIIPIIAYQFNTISLTFWISNLLASPIMGVIVVLGFLTYFISVISIPLARLICIPLNLIIILLSKIANICAKLPLSTIRVKTPYIISILFYYFFVILISYKKTISEKYQNINKRKLYSILIIFIVVIIVSSTLITVNKRLRIHFIDVGQGDSCLIITPNNKKILIDGGGSESGSFNVGEKTLLPYLLDRRIIGLDYIMISHFDTDHARTDYYM